ncbi:hypothetical protein EDC04DRAFT_2611722 [Pisolithus marmoratus]|nr:hypothetical protein EDC04DRAFT_2611722 [Pisolithus marmoratus]
MGRRFVLGDIGLEVECLDRKVGFNFWTDKPSQLIRPFSTGTASTRISHRPTDEPGKDRYQFLIGSHVRDLKGLFVNYIKDLMGLDDVKDKGVMCSASRIAELSLPSSRGVAYVHGPTGGLCLNTSVQDALDFAWKLALVYKGVSPASLLDTCTAERPPVITEMLRLAVEILNLTYDEPKSEDARH